MKIELNETIEKKSDKTSKMVIIILAVIAVVGMIFVIRKREEQFAKPKLFNKVISITFSQNDIETGEVLRSKEVLDEKEINRLCKYMRKTKTKRDCDVEGHALIGKGYGDLTVNINYSNGYTETLYSFYGDDVFYKKLSSMYLGFSYGSCPKLCEYYLMLFYPECAKGL